jgi:hypothetical protein
LQLGAGQPVGLAVARRDVVSVSVGREEHGTARGPALVELARLRGVSLDDLMASLH